MCCEVNLVRFYLSFIVTCSIFLSLASTSPSLSTTNDSDRTPSLYVGEKAHLLCAYEEPIIGCKFVIPGVAYEIQLSPTSPPLTTRRGYKFSYYGSGLNHGECGVTIHNLTFSNQGQARCTIVTSDAEEMMENVDIRIKNATAWLLPKITLLNNDNPLKVGQTLMAECIVEANYDDDDDDEFANLSWHLNNEILTNSSSLQRTDDGGYQIKSILMHELRDIDNGKTLKCRLDSLSNSPSTVEHPLVLLLERENELVPKIGEPYDIVINFTAFPRPLSPKWKVNEKIIYYGKSNNGFISREFQYLGSNRWKAILHITNVTEEHFNLNYSLQVNDAYGSKSYNVRLDEHQQQLLNYNVDEDLTSSTKVINLDNERNSISSLIDVNPSTYRTQAVEITTMVSETTLMPTKATFSDEIEIIKEDDTRENNGGRYLGLIIVTTTFILMTMLLIVLISILCHYRKQVVVLKREIIQMTSENFYNSSSYPGLYNSVHLDLRGSRLMNISVDCIEVKNDYCVPDCNSNSGSEATNSHLYQSIEEANHVYDEIISTKQEQGKPNNYENNESMNCVEELKLEHSIPNESFIQRPVLMTIVEEEDGEKEKEASHYKKSSKSLESTYI